MADFVPPQDEPSRLEWYQRQQEAALRLKVGDELYEWLEELCREISPRR